MFVIHPQAAQAHPLSVQIQYTNAFNRLWIILGYPGATSRDDAILSGECLLQELKRPWELILTEPVPEMIKFLPADWAEKYFSAQSARRSSRVTLSPSYTM